MIILLFYKLVQDTDTPYTYTQTHLPQADRNQILSVSMKYMLRIECIKGHMFQGTYSSMTAKT